MLTALQLLPAQQLPFAALSAMQAHGHKVTTSSSMNPAHHELESIIITIIIIIMITVINKLKRMTAAFHCQCQQAWAGMCCSSSLLPAQQLPVTAMSGKQASHSEHTNWL